MSEASYYIKKSGHVGAEGGYVGAYAATERSEGAMFQAATNPLASLASSILLQQPNQQQQLLLLPSGWDGGSGSSYRFHECQMATIAAVLAANRLSWKPQWLL